MIIDPRAVFLLAVIFVIGLYWCLVRILRALTTEAPPKSDRPH
jgi:hypothetical protein